MSSAVLLTYGIAAAAVGGMLLRPKGTAEWMWATGGALVLLAAGLLPLRAGYTAVIRGADVYAFLVGIMALAELCRHEGVFAWLASLMLLQARSSPGRLLALVYVVGAIVTIALSNDTTAVVLTPAVIAALARTDADPRPYLFACAFVANAASFALPISNPANLVVFAGHVPRLDQWIAAFGLASAASIIVTFIALRLAVRPSLVSTHRQSVPPDAASQRTRFAAGLVGSAALLLIAASALGWPLGLTALAAAALATGIVGVRDQESALPVIRGVAWQIVPLVAGLFVIVAALNSSGASEAVRRLLVIAAHLGYPFGQLIIAGAFAFADNAFNNLPVALAGSYALHGIPASAPVARATLVAVDLGPNFSVTGSLATVLWLIALRRAGIVVTALQFVRLGALVTIPALIAASLLLR
ncbi:MAG: SLC13 family permease [Candidatus Eremiobacteraeota bacterium]|nr:SLC13 family permease [Candidatus Eremiobacteraeota bacterium]